MIAAYVCTIIVVVLAIANWFVDHPSRLKLGGEMFRVWVVIVAMVVGHEAIAGDRFLCIAEQSTGFRWDGQRWTIPQTIVHEKFLVEEVRPQQIDGKTHNFEVKQFRENWVSLWCNREVLRDGTVDSRIICGGLEYGMLIDTKSLRFQMAFSLGYIDGKDQRGSQLSITIGTCERTN